MTEHWKIPNTQSVYTDGILHTVGLYIAEILLGSETTFLKYNSITINCNSSIQLNRTNSYKSFFIC